jgi:hypothetical protein
MRDDFAILRHKPHLASLWPDVASRLFKVKALIAAASIATQTINTDWIVKFIEQNQTLLEDIKPSASEQAWQNVFEAFANLCEFVNDQLEYLEKTISWLFETDAGDLQAFK